MSTKPKDLFCPGFQKCSKLRSVPKENFLCSCGMKYKFSSTIPKVKYITYVRCNEYVILRTSVEHLMSALNLYVTTVTVSDLKHGKYFVENLLIMMIRWIILLLLSVVRIKKSSNNYLPSSRIFVMDKHIR